MPVNYYQSSESLTFHDIFFTRLKTIGHRIVNTCRESRADRSLPLSRASDHARITRTHGYVRGYVFSRDTRFGYSYSAREFGRPSRVRGSRTLLRRARTRRPHLRGSLARARNVVSRGGRRPIAFSGARSEAVPRARSGSSLTVRCSPRDSTRVTATRPDLPWTCVPTELDRAESSRKLEPYPGTEGESASSPRAGVGPAIRLALALF